MNRQWVLPVAVAGLVVAAGVLIKAFPKDRVPVSPAFAATAPAPSPFQDVTTKELMDRKEEAPVLWLFYNTGDVNSRSWADFGARSSRVIHKPYLNLCYETIVRAAAKNYRIEIIRGQEDAIHRLGGAEFVPQNLRKPKAFLLEEEIQFLACAFLAKFGGLWMSPSTICIKPVPVFPRDVVIGFGTSDVESYASKEGTSTPNTMYMWSGQPNSPIFMKWAAILYERQNGYQGGQRVRRDPQWDWTYVITGSGTNIRIDPGATVQRKRDGRRIELTDLLMAGTEGHFPFPIPKTAFMVPIPYFELDRRSKTAWFLRMSESQILDSDLVIRWLFDLSDSQCV